MVQEHRLTGEARAEATRVAKERGYKIFWGEEDWDVDGLNPVRGVAIITCLDGYQVKTADMPDHKRVVACKLNRGDLRPLLVLGVYAHAGQNKRSKREALIKSTFEWAASTGDVFFALGDWNASEDSPAMAGYLTTGGVRAADDVDRTDRGHTFHQTRKGVLVSSLIDYGVYGGELVLKARLRTKGVTESHDCVRYWVDWGASPKKNVWQK